MDHLSGNPCQLRTVRKPRKGQFFELTSFHSRSTVGTLDIDLTGQAHAIEVDAIRSELPRS